MKRRKPTTGKLLGELLLIGAVALVEKIASRKAKPVNEHDSEKAIQRKVTTAHIIYHAIGIFYNE